MKSQKAGQEKSQGHVHQVRITLSSKNVKNLEKVCAELVNGAKNKKLKVREDEATPVKASPVNMVDSPVGDGFEYYSLQECRPSKKGCTNFRWSPTMSRFLLPFLVEQARQGRKINRTFKRQALMEAAKAVSEKFQLSCSDSNVENHLRTVKTRYAQIKRLQTLSNARWDSEEKKIIMDAAAYNEHVRANPKDEPFINKRIDLYNEMVVICSNEPVTRSLANVITVEKAEEDPRFDGDDVNIVMDEDMDAEEEEEEAAQSRSEQVSTSSDSNERTALSGKRDNHLENKINHLAFQVGELAAAIRISRKDITAQLYKEVMRSEGYDELSLVKAFDYLNEHENLGRGFLVKNSNLRSESKCMAGSSSSRGGDSVGSTHPGCRFSSEYSSLDLAGVQCYCGLKAKLRTSWTFKNPGRRFLGCPSHRDHGGCTFFNWVDIDISERGKAVMNELRFKIQMLEGELERFRSKEAQNMAVMQTLRSSNADINHMTVAMYGQIRRLKLAVKLLCLCLILSVMYSMYVTLVDGY